MTKVKFCGLSRLCDVEAANRLKPEYVGFVFASKSRRYVTTEKAAGLKRLLHHSIQTVGVFVSENPETVASLLNNGTIDIAQLHGNEPESYIKQLRALTDKLIIKAFPVDSERDIDRIRDSTADYVLLDSKEGGTGTAFDWSLIRNVERPYFLAGGLGVHNVEHAVNMLKPYGVDVSSGIETDGYKDKGKMEKFISLVRKGG